MLMTISYCSRCGAPRFKEKEIEHDKECICYDHIPNERKILEELSKFLIFPNGVESNIVVIFPTQVILREFEEKLKKILEEVPEWLKPSIRQRTGTIFETQNVRIYLKLFSCNFRGLRINQVFVSDLLTDKDFYEMLETVFPALGNNKNISNFTQP